MSFDIYIFSFDLSSHLPLTFYFFPTSFQLHSFIISVFLFYILQTAFYVMHGNTKMNTYFSMCLPVAGWPVLSRSNQKAKTSGLIVMVIKPFYRCLHRRLVSSVGRAPVCCAGGRGFEPQTGPTLRVLK